MLLFADTSPSDAQFLIQIIFDGLAYGSLIALIALGYSMVYGIIGLINFAHGDVFMLGAFLSGSVMFALSRNGMLPETDSYLLVGLCVLGLMLLAGTMCGAINMLIDRLVYKPLRKAPKLAPLVSAIGVSFVLLNIGYLWGGSGEYNLPEIVFAKENLLSDESGLRINVKSLLIIVLVVPLMIGLLFLVKRTRLGKAMRAVQQNPTAAELMGIPVERIIATTFGIGGALAGFAGVIDAVTRGTNVFGMGYQFGLYAFTAAVLGGIGSIPGAVLGSLIIGLVRAVIESYLNAQWSNAAIFGILVLILIFRPAGLLGRNAREKV
jgi:branched-chain amino acid transport system permease protein